MATANVYRFDYYDRVLKCDRRSIDYATGDAIMAQGAKMLVETEQVVDEKLLEDDGTIRASHVYAEVPARAKRAHSPRRAA